MIRCRGINSSAAWIVGMVIASAAAQAAGSPAGAAARHRMAFPTTAPVRVHCGQIIRIDTVLANDLHGCPDIGLAIGAPNITLDLNGHTVEGNGTPLDNCPEEEPCNSGITNSEIDGGEVVNGPGYAGVTIKNGTVRGFAGVGVYEFGVSDNRIAHLDVRGTDDGVILTRSSYSFVREVSVTGFKFMGIVGSHSHDLTVSNSSALDGAGFYGFLFNDVQHSLLQGNRSVGSPDADGIALVNGSHDNLVRGNTTTGNGGAIAIDDSTRNVVTRNEVHDNIHIGIYANNGDENRFTRNVINRNSDGSAGGLVLDSDDSGTSDGNLVADNIVFGNVGDGILLTPGALGTHVLSNITTNNTGDGIDAQGGSTTVTANIANHNGALGIYATPGTIDGGYNKASANGDARQCVGVACS